MLVIIFSEGEVSIQRNHEVEVIPTRRILKGIALFLIGLVIGFNLGLHY
jgi:hypothetical protein